MGNEKMTRLYYYWENLQSDSHRYSAIFSGGFDKFLILISLNVVEFNLLVVMHDLFRHAMAVVSIFLICHEIFSCGCASYVYKLIRIDFQLWDWSKIADSAPLKYTIRCHKIYDHHSKLIWKTPKLYRLWITDTDRLNALWG